MKLILACTAVVLLLSVVQLARPMRRRKNSIGQIYRDANITPEPEELLQVYFKKIEVTPGIEIAPEDAVDLPTIVFDFHPGCYYTFLGLNIDYAVSSLSPGLLAFYVNFNGGMISESDAIATWLGPSPSPGSGLNRYLLYLYKQPGLIDATNKTLLSYEVDRLRFSLDAVVATYGLSHPSGTFFVSSYPLSECED